MSQNIAELTWDSETKKVINVVFFRKNLRFKCKRCAVFCCRLGGPRVNKKDVEHLRKAGHEPKDFLDAETNSETRKEGSWEGILKQSKDGSCIFLQYDAEGKTFRCSVYDLRPTLCRFYPFEFERTGLNKGILRFIPCCNGLNARDGSNVDRNFIEDQLLDAILDLI